MNNSTVKSVIFTLSTLCLSSMTVANHPMDVPIEVDQDSLHEIRLSRLQLQHDEDGKYRISGEVRRPNKYTLPIGHIDLVASDENDETVYEDAEFYWPRMLNRRYKYPSDFVFTLPETAVNTTTLHLSFHQNKLASKPKPTH
jgi:hypothetical protein